MLKDASGLAVTADSPDAVAHLDAAIASYCGLQRSSGDHLKQAFAAEPQLLMGQILRGHFMMLFGKRDFVPRAIDAAARAEAALAKAGATPREQLHLSALRHWTRGRMREAAAALEAVLAEHPRDLLAVRLAQHLYFYMGMSDAMRQSTGRVLPAWDRALPGYGFVLGCHAFGLEETGAYDAAERAGRDAVALNPGDVWAAHAVAHVCEMENRVDDGIRWLNSLDGEWGAVNNFVFHVHWHRCLYLLDLGRHDEVLACYDRNVRAESTDEQLDISNAVALLWRLEQLGVAVGGRWAELAAQSRRHTGDHLLVFPDIHYVMALAAAGDREALDSWQASAHDFAASAPEHEAVVMSEIGLTLAEAAIAHRQGEWDRVVAALLPVRHDIERIGGSHAQRDVFQRLLLDAALKAGRADVVTLLLRERARRRARDGWAARQIVLAASIGKAPAMLTA
jgi:tetratricopeptide (TPR) repeat protein